ncbi:Gfo/Idh/MocA family protein [Aurantiacibacter flavus]|uniref:Gfo/Idh/MocA family oxidoreductase n=1 Tax=Aurantiacibacter flavus TaxID=3145232 RepID=A0ABV0CRP5_9SPHN
MTAPFRLAVIGMGKIAHDQHLPAIADSKYFELAAMVDRRGQAEQGVPFFGSVEDLAASDLEIDAVAICTPPQVRHDIAQFALERGWHTLLEKPPGATLAEVVALRETAKDRERTLFTAWHSRYAAGVEPARKWLANRKIVGAKVTWREDVRVWHPGQDWIWQPGGFGVFDPGINALSIITHILPHPLFVVKSSLAIPANLSAPIAAQVSLRDRLDVPVEMDLDFRQEGPQHWDIEVQTDAGVLKLGSGGAVLSLDKAEVAEDASELRGEYPSIYRKFGAMIRAEVSEVDVSPLRLVADAFLCASFEVVDEFHE